MAQTIIFVLFLALPFFFFLANAAMAKRESRGIAAGIPKPKTARAARAKRATVRTRRTSYCGRGFTHFALALIGSQDSCRYCPRLQEVPPEPHLDPDGDAAIAEAEQIINRAKQ